MGGGLDPIPVCSDNSCHRPWESCHLSSFRLLIKAVFAKSTFSDSLGSTVAPLTSIASLAMLGDRDSPRIPRTKGSTADT